MLVKEERTVKEERSFWRDQSISARHRKYGWNCPCMDIDFVLYEYESAELKAVVEYKAGRERKIDLSQKNYVVQRKIADKFEIPYLLVFYTSEKWVFIVIPANEFAKQYVREKTVFSEKEYVELLYKMRGIEAEKEILSALNVYKPTDPSIKVILPPPTTVTQTKPFVLPHPASNRTPKLPMLKPNSVK